MARPRKFDENAVLDKAMDLFWRQGYEGAGLAELLEAMGLQRGSLYKAWGSKKGLFLAVLDRYDTLYIAPGLDLLRGVGDAAALSGEERIRRVFQAHDERGCLMCNSAGGVAGTDRDVAAWIEQRIERLSAAFETALRAAASPPDAQALSVQANDLLKRYIGTRIGQRVKGASGSTTGSFGGREAA